MPTSMTFEEHLRAIETASARLREHVEAAGWDAPVPTCPEWDARALCAHQAMVHRWATGQLAGNDPDDALDPAELAHRDDLPAYFDEGARILVATLRHAPADLQAMTFLAAAPPPRDFWARRQAHETTVHAVDALAASLGRLPTAAEAGLDTGLAIDGLDELLVGFFTRGRSKLYDGAERTVLVAPIDDDRRWVLQIGERMTVADSADGVEPDVTLSGTAAQLYLGLWNRGDEISTSGDERFVARWREVQRVRWS